VNESAREREGGEGEKEKIKRRKGRTRKIWKSRPNKEEKRKRE